MLEESLESFPGAIVLVTHDRFLLDRHGHGAEPLREELAHFLSCVATGRQPVTDGVEALGVLNVLEQAAKSVRAKAGH